MFANTFNSGNQGGGGGLFGGQQNKPQGGGLFQSFAPSTPQNQAQGSAFGQIQNQNTGGGIFGQSNTGNTGFGASVGGQQGNAFQGNSMFGQNQPQTQGGLFGQPQNNQGGTFGQPTQGGIFGQPQNQQNQSTTGIFGQSNPVQQQGGAGLFGQTQQQGGAGLFGQTQQQGGTGLFGQTQGGPFGSTPQNNPSTGLFGAVSSTGNSSFMGAQQNQGGNLFGSTNPNQGNSPFGNPTNQGNTFGSNQQTTGLFGAPQQNTNTSGNSPFGGFGSNANPTTSLFGAPQQSNNNSTFSNPANKFGGTSWGVPTPAQPVVQGGSNFQPARSKNIKLDAKHLVKCISALDQFQGCCKEEVRINFIQNGGQPPLVNQQNQTTQPNQVGSMGFAKPQNNSGPLTSLPSFGGANTSLFGGQQQQNTGGFGVNSGNSTLFGGAATTGASNSLFGTNTQTQSPSFFGGQQPQQQGNSLFGGQPQQQTSFLSGQPQQQQGSLFGGQPQQQQGTSLFGAQPQQQGTLFGTQQQQQGTSLFGAQPQQQGTMFGAQQQQQGTSLFGAQPQQQGTMFGAQNPQGQGMSLFGASNPQTAGFSQGGTSLFNPSTPLQAPPSLYPTGLGAGPTQFSQTPQMQQMQPFAAPMPNPYNNGQFAQMISPLFQQQQQQMDPNLQLLLPQLLLGYALNQNQNPQSNDPSAQGNSTLDMINRLITNMSMPKTTEANAKNINTLLNPTPFDEFLKEESNSKWSERQAERRSLFSEAEIREF
jgi:nuclear pore complex protein Nup98-Nup96